MQVENCKIIHLPKVADARGNLTYIEGRAMYRSVSSEFSIFTMFPAVRIAGDTR